MTIVRFGAYGNSGEYVVKEYKLSLYFVAKSAKNSQIVPDTVVFLAFGNKSKLVQLQSFLFIPIFECAPKYFK